ncbi:Eco57I restriction-modification methylase domain-containing protein [Flavobacterium sp. RSB2_4_14]|uniref:Eco57I restriction-modification methylase domain-containing protein n=1 Tax=Flavobacterium sp. RSB2_4_14 TaxID=3447665 RepID=UPI003F373250
MPLFQNSVVAKQLQSQDKNKLVDAWNAFKNHFHNTIIQDNIRSSKEEQYQGEFLIDLFVNVLGYTKNPTPNFTLTTEYKNVKDSKKADGAILINDKVRAVIELKGTNTTDLNKIEVQAFGYKNNQPDCVYVITSNFEKVRFYIDNATEYIEFNLFTLSEKEFELMYLCLAFENIANDVPKKLKEQSVSQEKDITKKLYTDYSLFKRELHQDLVKQNPEFDALELFQKSQKLLDRFLFIFFAEDRNLLPTNLIFRINKEWRQLQEMRMNISLYDRYKIYFNDLNKGAKVVLPAFTQTTASQKEEHQIFAYNGGLFQPDAVLDTIKINDELLYTYTQKLSHYDFASEVDVNILGHIFENSLNELDEIKAQLEGGSIDKQSTKRKKDGVFYTPKYITKYIVDNTVGKLCQDKKAEINIIEEDYFTDKKRTKTTKQPLLEKLTAYRNWLLQITICDPACGSGAFLNQALDFLIQEHKYIDELQAKLFGDALILSDVEKSILENNLYGVDLNEESVEIAKLSLWLRTAQPNRKLNDLNNNIKCGNSLIDDVTIASDKAFNWQNEFPKIFDKGGFDIIIGNPPYVQVFDINLKEALETKFEVFKRNNDLYSSFYELSINLLKSRGILGFITPNSFIKGDYFKNLREFFIKYQILSIVDFNNELIFEDANVFSAILILEKKNPTKNWILKSDLSTIKGEIEIGISTFIQENSILNKFKNVKVFEDYFFIKDVGFNYWSVGGEKTRGNSIGDRVLYKGKKQSENDISYTKGSNFNRYSGIENENFLRFNYKDFLNENDTFRFSEELLKTRPKLIYRQTSSSLISTVDFDANYCDKTVHIIVNRENTNINYLYIMCLFNSSLLNYFYKLSTEETGRAFAQVKTVNVKKIPFLDSENKQPFIEKADLMLSLNKDLQEQSQKFQRTIQRKFELTDLPKKLQDWYLLSYADFIKELGKLKIKLTLSQEAEWEDYFTTEANKANAIKTQINATDKAIDAMVYELYGLSKEEIEIVENS